MEAIKNGLCKNLTPAQLWSGARFFLLLNLGLIIYAVALNFYCAPNHFVFGGTTGLSVVLATCFPALSVSTFMWITNAVLDVLGCVFLGIKTMGWTLYSSFMLSFYSSMCEKLFPVSQPLTDDTLLELCFAVALPAIASGIVFLGLMLAGMRKKHAKYTPLRFHGCGPSLLKQKGPRRHCLRGFVLL